VHACRKGFDDSIVFGELEILNNVVDVILLPPLDEVVPHLSHLFHIKFPGSTKPQKVSVIKLAQNGLRIRGGFLNI
jgi:hypothetical protein